MTKKELIVELKERRNRRLYVPPYDVLLSIYSDDEEIDELMIAMCFNQPQPRDIVVLWGLEQKIHWDNLFKDFILNEK